MFKLIKFIIGLVIFLVIAAIAFVITLVVINWKNKPKKREVTYQHSVSEFSSLTVNVDVKDSYVEVVKSKNDKVTFTYYDSKTREFDNVKEDVDILNNSTVTLKSYQTGKWYNRIFFTLKGRSVYCVKVEVPEGVNINVKTDNGNIKFMENLSVNTLTADTTNGSIKFDNVKATSVDVNTVNGEILATGTNATELFKARTRKGLINVTNFTSISLVLVMDLSTDSGNINVDITNTVALANIKLHTGNGNIGGKVTVITDALYKISANAHNGTVSEELRKKSSDLGISTLDLSTDNGNIDLIINNMVA